MKTTRGDLRRGVRRVTGLLAVVLVLAADGAVARKVATPSAPAYDAFVARGVAQGQRRRFDEAAASFDRAIALDPARPEA